jgi:hypothetical protein
MHQRSFQWSHSKERRQICDHQVFAFWFDCLNLPFYEEESDNEIRRVKSIDLKILEFVSKK